MEYWSTSTGSHLAGMQTKMIKHALEFLYENLHVFSQAAEFSLPSQFQDPWRNQRGNKLGLGSVFLYCIYGISLYLPPFRIIFHCKINMIQFNRYESKSMWSSMLYPMSIIASGLRSIKFVVTLPCTFKTPYWCFVILQCPSILASNAARKTTYNISRTPFSV